MSTYQIGFKPEQLDKILRKLSPGLYMKIVGPFLNKLGLVLSRDMVLHAPVQFNRLRPSLNKGGAGNIWKPFGSVNEPGLIIGTNVTHKGRSYPAKLDRDPRYHYRRGPFAGQQTAGFFSDAPERTNTERAALVGDLADDVAAEWKK